MAAHTVYAVASGKGGVGKTATTVNLGASLAEAGYTVAIVDTDLGMANLGGFIGIEPEQTLHEVLAGDASLEEATYEALNGLAVVPSGISLNGFANVETAALADAVDALRQAFDYVLLDLGAGLSHDTVLPLALADAVILVATPQPAAIQDTAKTRQITERLGGRVAGVVLTRAGNPADLSLEEVEETLDLPVLASIPEDNAVPASAREGQAVLQHTPDSPVVEGYRGLAGIIEDESLANAPVVPEVPEPDPTPDAGEEPAGDAGTAADPAGGDPTPEEAPSADDAAPQPMDGGTAGEQPEARTSGGTTQPDASAEAGPGPTAPGEEASPDEPETQAAEPETQAAEPETQSPEEAGGESTDDGGDSAEQTAAEIAAAIEDAANDAGASSPGEGAGASADQGATDAEQSGGSTDPQPDQPAGEPATEGTGEASPEEAADAGDDAGAPVEDLFGGAEQSGADADMDDVPEEVEAAAREAEAAKDEAGSSLQVESQAAEDSDEGKAVDELFAVEGASPDDIDDDDEEESGGFLSKLFG